MANHAKVTFRKIVAFPMADEAVRGIIQAKWGGSLVVEWTPWPEDERHEGTWSVTSPGLAEIFFQVWLLRNHRGFEFRHPHESYCFWAQEYVADQLARKFKGLISDEGVSGKHTPDKFNTPMFFSDYVKRQFKRHPFFGKTELKYWKQLIPADVWEQGEKNK